MYKSTSDPCQCPSCRNRREVAAVMAASGLGRMEEPTVVPSRPLKMAEVMKWLKKLPDSIGDPGKWTHLDFADATDEHLDNTIGMLERLSQRLESAAVAVAYKMPDLRLHRQRRQSRRSKLATTLTAS